MPDPKSATAGHAPLRETRYSLKELLAEVAADRLTGAFGQEKLRQRDIRRTFKAKGGARREK